MEDDGKTVVDNEGFGVGVDDDPEDSLVSLCNDKPSSDWSFPDDDELSALSGQAVPEFDPEKMHPPTENLADQLNRFELKTTSFCCCLFLSAVMTKLPSHKVFWKVKRVFCKYLL